MNREASILAHKQFNDYMERNASAEKNRLFCGHGLSHALDVSEAAVAMAMSGKLLTEEGAKLSIEENKKLTIKEDVIRAAGLLHDIGRWREYEDGQDHALASAELAVEILRDCGYNFIEEALIAEAIKSHRTVSYQEKLVQNQVLSLTDILYKCDKIVRPCESCKAKSRCKHHNVSSEGKETMQASQAPYK